jgi:hypothetical protein
MKPSVQRTLTGGVVADDSLSIAKLKEGMNRYLEEVRGGKVRLEEVRGGGGSRTAITAIAKYFMMELLPTKFVANSNAITDGDETKARREWNDRNFSNGTYCFTIPVDGCISRPDPNYSVAAGVRIWFIRWEALTRAPMQKEPPPARNPRKKLPPSCCSLVEQHRQRMAEMGMTNRGGRLPHSDNCPKGQAHVNQFKKTMQEKRHNNSL